MKTTTNTVIKEEGTGTGGLPSADLIKYRFDTIDITLEKLDKKLEAMNGQIVTPKDFANAKLESAATHLDHENRIRSLEKTKDTQDGSIKTLKWAIGILGTALTAAIALFAAFYS